MSRKDPEISTLTSEEETLLTRLVDKDVIEVKLRIGSEGIVYQGLGDIAEEYDWQRLRRLLRSLTNRGFLIAKETDRIIFCPNCGSYLALSKYTCPNCQSINVNRVELIEHPFCGFTGVKEKFISGSSLVCPNCETNLGPLEGKPPRNGSREDYKIIGSNFECEKCGNKFNKPNDIHICQKCDTIFDYKRGRYEKIHDYDIPEQVRKIMRSQGERTILLIEDNPDDAKIITRYFSKSEKPFRIEHVISGREGLEKVVNKYYDVILLDYKLPDINGLEVLKEIKKNKINIPIIMLTGADDRKTAVEAMKLGAFDYIVKSLKAYKELPSIIQQLAKE
jgi:CheY-like chemotaxis protein